MSNNYKLMNVMLLFLKLRKITDMIDLFL
jgi:hypothetical protein